MTAQAIAAGAPVAVAQKTASLGRVASAFGMSACLTILCNTGFVALGQSWPSVETYLDGWTGNAWRTLGGANLIVFLLFAILLLRRRYTIGGWSLAMFLIVCVAASTFGLGYWSLTH